MTKHTPGPWELWTGCSWRRFGSVTADRTVCEPVTQHDGHPDLYFPNGGADGPDARLIAAAPDLLEALKTALGFVAAWSGYYQVAYETGREIAPKHQAALDQIAAAIAKAEGR